MIKGFLEKEKVIIEEILFEDKKSIYNIAE